MHARWVALAMWTAIVSTMSTSFAAPKDDKKKAPATDDGTASPPDDDVVETDENGKPIAKAKDPGEIPNRPVEADHPVVPPAPVAGPKFTWEPYGFLRMQYRFVQDDPIVQFIGRDDGFELQNARVGLRGLLDDRAAFTISFDGAVDERAKINVQEGRLRVGLRDAFVDVGVGGRATIRGGYFQPWADPEALVPDTQRELIDKPIESRGVRPTEGFQTPGLTPGRSIGAAFHYDRAPGRDPEPGVAIQLAVQNGADEYSSDNDNNLPALSASALARFAKDGFVVGSVRYNPRTVGAIPALQDESDLQLSGGVHAAGGPISFGAAAIFTRTTFGTTNGPPNNAIGGHAQLMFLVPGTYPLAIGYRFGVLDPQSTQDNDRVIEHTAGATIGVPRMRMRVQLQATYVADQRDLAASRVQVAAEVSL